MMKYEIFKDVVENAVLDYLPPEYQNSELHLKRVKKVNGMDYDGLVVRKEDTNVCPVINLTQLYEDYKLSEDIELVTKNAADIVHPDIHSPVLHHMPSVQYLQHFL